MLTALLAVVLSPLEQAGASTVSQDLSSVVTFTAGAGEANAVTMSTTIVACNFGICHDKTRIVDTGATLTLIASQNCFQVDTHTVDCSDVVPPQTLVVNLGDLNDTFSFAYAGTLGDGLHPSVTVDGGAGADTITGLGRDTLRGGDGNDTVNGGSIGDTLEGGNGNDALTGGAGNDALNGGRGSDTLTGGSENDTLNGGSGIDSFDGGSGFDTADYTTDFYEEHDASCGCIVAIYGVNVSLDGVANDGNWYWDTPDEDGSAPAGDNVETTVEKVIGTLADDSLTAFPCSVFCDAPSTTLIGGGGNDTLQASFGINTLDGGEGNDTISGGGESDLITGGAGDDTLSGGTRDDRLVETGDVNFTLTNSTLTGLGNDTLSSIESATLIGGNGANGFVTTAFGGPVELHGGSGNDTFTAGVGNDTIDGGFGTDELTETGDLNFTLTNSSLVGLGSDAIGQLERVTLTGGPSNNTIDASASGAVVALDGSTGDDILLGGSAGDTLAGSAGTDDLTGGSGNDTLDGGLGADTLTGGAGDDALIGAGGIDLLQGGDNNDTLSGGTENDTLDGGTGGTDSAVESADVNFSITDGSLTGLGTDTLSNIEKARLTGGPGNNTINGAGFSGPQDFDGGDGNDVLTAGPGAATLAGGAGSDALNGGSGADTLIGGTGDDSLSAAGGVDVLQGGDDNDTLTGGPANDSLDGGNGADRVFEANDANFTLTNSALFGNGSDSLASVESAALTGGPGDNALNASTFTNGPVTLDGVGGADTLLGGAGNDTLIGGAGVDSFDAGAGDDTVHARDGESEGSVSCGAGSGDVAAVDSGDTPGIDCETVELPPTITTLTGPSGLVKSRNASFSFTGSASADHFKCSLDAAPFALCTSPQPYESLLDGQHTFQVFAEDSANDAGPLMSRTWTIDASPPNTRIVSGPSRTTVSHTAKFGFRSSEPGSRFQCKLDRHAWRACSSPKTYRDLRSGRHTFRARAIDAAGNVDPTPAKKTWTIL